VKVELLPIPHEQAVERLAEAPRESDHTLKKFILDLCQRCDLQETRIVTNRNVVLGMPR
jgi:hypothetical protein